MLILIPVCIGTIFKTIRYNRTPDYAWTDSDRKESKAVPYDYGYLDYGKKDVDKMNEEKAK